MCSAEPRTNEKPEDEIAYAVRRLSELNEPRWSVVSFEICVANNLTYAQAEQKLKELEAAKVSGLCIITDEAAARIS